MGETVIVVKKADEEPFFSSDAGSITIALICVGIVLIAVIVIVICMCRRQKPDVSSDEDKVAK